MSNSLAFHRDSDKPFSLYLPNAAPGRAARPLETHISCSTCTSAVASDNCDELSQQVTIEDPIWLFVRQPAQEQQE